MGLTDENLEGDIVKLQYVRKLRQRWLVVPLSAVKKVMPLATAFLAAAVPMPSFAQTQVFNTEKLLLGTKNLEIYYVPTSTNFEQHVDIDRFMSISCKYKIPMTKSESIVLDNILLKGKIESAFPVDDIYRYSEARFTPAIILRFNGDSGASDLVFSSSYANGYTYGKFDGRAVRARYAILKSLSAWTLEHEVDNVSDNSFRDCRSKEIRPQR